MSTQQILLAIILILIVFMGCIKPHFESQFPSILWRGGTGIHLSAVLTPEGFTITPQQAVDIGEKKLGSSKKCPYLFADQKYYYFGYGTQKTAWETGVKIDGRTGKVSKIEKETENSKSM